ncbi:MAG: PD-(D/E)XK nuclease family protein [bacterium]
MGPFLGRIISLIEGYRKIKEIYCSSYIKKIDNLLRGYADIKSAKLNSLDSPVKGFAKLSDNYTKNTISRFQTLFDGFNAELKELRKRQRETAEEINILKVLDFTYDEIKHSKFLAYLFDPLETHAQASLFFEIFLKELNLPQEYSQHDYKVQTEVAQDESRIDIEIISKTRGEQGFIIHIENKVTAMPQREQIQREDRDLQKKAEGMNILNANRHGFLLSSEKPDEDLLKGTSFRWIDWRTIANCLENFIKRAQAEKARWTAEQYLSCIEENIIAKMKGEEVKNEETE